MKKLAASILSLSFLSLATTALADIPINIVPPAGLAVSPTTPISAILTNAIRLVFVIAVLAVLVYLIWGAFQWITSGGDKEAVSKARGRITAALIGLAILALSFLILVVVGQILGLNILSITSIPTLVPTLTPTPTPTLSR